MKKLWLVLSLSILATGCVAAGYPRRPVAGGYPLQRPMYPQPVPFHGAPLPIGRWDNVMMLAPGSTVQVLMASGAVATAEVISASTTDLRIRTVSGDLDLPVSDVMRVDRLKAPGNGAVRDGVEGAAWGAGIVGVAGLLVGRMPPPRLFAAGAVIGASQGVQLGRMDAGPATIYLSPAVASVSVVR
jgi:hypothetical protein